MPVYYTVKMVKQGRNTSGKFEAKSGSRRAVRTMRLTDTAWEKLGVVADSRGVTRADLIEEWAKQDFLQQVSQPTLPSKEIITKDTRKTGTELAHRLVVSSAALTNWLNSGTFSEKSRKNDPDDIAWDRETSTKKYRPILDSN